MLNVECLPSRANSPAERVFLIQQLRRLRVHESRAGDDRQDFSRRAVEPLKFSAERAADDAFLNPLRALGQFAIRREARELGAGAGATGRAVIGFAGTLDEVPR